MDRSRPLQLDRLRFRYSPTVVGWNVDVNSLSLSSGEHILLSGSSGGGKSTLLYLIAGLLDPVEGRVLVGGTDLHSMRGGTRDLYRGRNIGMIFQTFNLLHGFSAVENVMAALMFSALPGREHRSYAADLLAKLGIKDPDADPDLMSVGQQQRVAVARAVACEPILVLADEPTASLDPELTIAAMDLIQETCRQRGAALLCTSHDPAMAQRFERRIALSELGAHAAPAKPALAPKSEVAR